MRSERETRESERESEIESEREGAVSRVSKRQRKRPQHGPSGRLRRALRPYPLRGTRPRTMTGRGAPLLGHRFATRLRLGGYSRGGFRARRVVRVGRVGRGRARQFRTGARHFRLGARRFRTETRHFWFGTRQFAHLARHFRLETRHFWMATHRERLSLTN